MGLRTALGFRAFLVVMPLALWGCSDPAYDTSTPQRMLSAAEQMLVDERPDLLPTLIHLQPRDITYDDGVTEASAIDDVREKLGDMLAQLWRVAEKLRNRFPTEASKEVRAGQQAASQRGLPPWITRLLTDPRTVIDEQRTRLEAEDLGDGTAALTIDGEPAFGGVLGMLETGDGWRFTVPIELARSSGWWPDTRHEWAVVAALMLGIENSLRDFEKEIDGDKFASLGEASERVGRIVGESVVVQSIIYAQMKRTKETKESAATAGSGDPEPAVRSETPE